MIERLEVERDGRKNWGCTGKLEGVRNECDQDILIHIRNFEISKKIELKGNSRMLCGKQKIF